MKTLIAFLVIAVTGSLAAPSGLLGLGALDGLGGATILGGPAYYGGGTILGAPVLGTTLLTAAAPAVTVQKTITTPSIIATGHVLAAPAAATVVAGSAHADGPVALNAVVAGPSGIISSKQVNPGGVAVVGLGHGLDH